MGTLMDEMGLSILYLTVAASYISIMMWFMTQIA